MENYFDNQPLVNSLTPNNEYVNKLTRQRNWSIAGMIVFIITTAGLYFKYQQIKKQIPPATPAEK
jgi:hypothetical protein